MMDHCKKLILAPILTLILTPILATANEAESPPSSAQLSLDDLRTFTDVFNQVRRNYVEETDAAYMEADDFRQLDNSSRGRYSGIGVELVIRNKSIRIVHVMDDGPASKAGLVRGDVITSVNQKDVRDQDLQLAINGLRGEAGSEVEITVKHHNGEVSQHTLVRDYVKVASVFSRPVDKDYGYFRITHFTRKSADELLEQIDYMKANRDTPLKGVVLDLRNNPGGVLKPAVTIADGFLDDGMIVYTRGRAASQLEYTANPGQWLPCKITAGP